MQIYDWQIYAVFFSHSMEGSPEFLFFSFFSDTVSFCHPDWSAGGQSRLSVVSTTSGQTGNKETDAPACFHTKEKASIPCAPGCTCIIAESFCWFLDFKRIIVCILQPPAQHRNRYTCWETLIYCFPFCDTPFLI